MHSHVSLGSNQTYCKLYSNQNLFTPLQYPCNAIYSLSLSLIVGSTNLCSVVLFI